MDSENKQKGKITPNQWKSFFITLVIGLVFIYYYILFYNKIDSSAALYIGFPFLFALGLSLVAKAESPMSMTMKWLTIVLVLSAIVLKEGVICILMASPIFYSLAAFFTSMFVRIKESRKSSNKIKLSALTVMLAATSLEGTHELVTFDRFNQVEYSKTVNIDIDSIRQNLSQPNIPELPRPFLLRIFPLPVQMQGTGLKIGDERRLDFEYKKWIITNLHKGSTIFRIAESNTNYIRFEIPYDDSYISNYLTWKSSEVLLQQTDDGKTKITWRLSYERKLDPFWYFGPMQHYAVWLTAKVLTENVVTHH